MEPRNVILWIVLPVLAVLAMAAGVQAQELREVPASEILEKIQAGEDVFLENVHITGEFNLGRIDLETVHVAREASQIENWDLEEELKIVESEMTIKDSVFENDVDFSNTQFKKTLDFRSTSFLGISDFRGTNFSGGADFWNASFGGDANFDAVNFGGDANFRYGLFGGDAYFGGADFSGDARFWGVSFGSDANFGSVSFGGSAEFWFADFSGDAYFANVRFGGSAQFWLADFSGDAYFGGASFSHDANFGTVNFGGDANFGTVRFGGCAIFVGADFGGDANFERADFGSDARFWDASFGSDAIFNYTKFNKIFFSNIKFTKFSFYETDFKSMKVEWASLEDALVFDGPTYIKLIKNFREMEQFGDADDAYYQYRRLSQANKEWSFSKLGDIFMWLSCGYGVKPQYTIILAVVMILIFTIIYWLGNGIRRLKENDEGRYLFSWDDVPGKDNKRFIRYLGSNFSIDQAENVEIRKSDDGKTIYIHNDDESAKIMIDKNGEKATLKTSDHEPIHLKVKKENGELNIYERGKEDVSFCDAFYFSVVTFTTVGYGDLYPADRYRMVAVMIEGLVGWLILALFLVTLANVMIRP